MKKRMQRILIILLLVPAFCDAQQTVVTTPHNLSVGGPGTIKADVESEVCIFCHTPHAARPISPLWNRNDPGSSYTLYNSSTLNASLGQPDGSSVLCLSCHDGTIALGEVVSRTSDITFAGGITVLPTANRNNLVTDLSDDHPVSFVYSSAIATADGQLKAPTAIGAPVELEGGKVQCISCHDPHNNMYDQFLVATTENSDLCFKCHDRNYWHSSSHNLSTASWNGSGTNPWAHIETPYISVAGNACENCHAPHTANGKLRLLKADTDEYNCLDCHNGNVASTDIESEVLKTYAHSVTSYNGIHDAVEISLSSTMHVECQDCHNPHAVNNSTASAPNASGFLAGVRGIDTDGIPVDPISYEYELCYRCHADSPSKPSSPTLRVISENNVRVEFDLGNPSHHGVEGPGQNSNVPSLYNGYTESSVIYCTDCHASNSGTSPEGPHGSTFNHILKDQYITTDNNQYNQADYQLCWNCHDPNSILGDDSFKEHRKHIDGEDTPCNACHDPHGVAGTTNNNTHLINFDLNIVQSNGSGQRQFVDQGNFAGYCLLRCHGKGHGAGMNYP